MTQTPGGERPQKLGEILLSSGIIDKLQLNTALKYQREWDRKLGEALVELGFISEAVLVKVLSKFLQVPAVELSQVRVNPLAVQKVPRRLAEKYGLMPMEIEGEGPKSTLIVAMIDPTNLVAVDEVAFTSACKVRPVVAAHSDIEKAIRRHYGDDRVVDVFFETTLPPAVGSSDEMVVLQRGQETTYHMPMQPQNQSPPPVAPSSAPAVSLAQLSSDVLLQALVAVLVRNGFIDEQQLLQEAAMRQKDKPKNAP